MGFLLHHTVRKRPSVPWDHTTLYSNCYFWWPYLARPVLLDRIKLLLWPLDPTEKDRYNVIGIHDLSLNPDKYCFYDRPREVNHGHAISEKDSLRDGSFPVPSLNWKYIHVV